MREGALMETCPSCGSPRIRPSKSRSRWERLRRQFSTKRIYRCQACQWRGWGTEMLDQHASEEGRVRSAAPPPDIDAIDRALEEARNRPEE